MRVRPDDAAAAEALAASPALWIEGIGDATVTALVPHGRGELLLEVDRVRRVETAKRLVHAQVWIPEEVREAVQDAALSEAADRGDPRGWVGRPVRHGDRTLGTVDAVDGSPLQPLLRVRGPHGEVLLPALAPYVHAGDDAVLLVDPPEGLLDPT